MKRIFLFLLTNIAVMIALSVTASIIFSLIGQPMSEVFGEWSHLVVFAAVFGIGGSVISLLLSKPIAKFSTGARTVDGSEGEAERWLVSTVEDLARRAGIDTPEVAVYEGAANAFATGAFRNSALVAVSTDIMRQMTKEELRAVLGHEISHVANGDMVTLCLIQGVLNVFVILISRMVAQIASSAGDDSRRRSSNPFIYMAVVVVMEIALGAVAMLIVCAFSRRREFAADAGSARLLGTPSSMIAALRRLGNLQPGTLPDSLKAMGIAEGKRTSLWSTHPSLDSRIEALANYSWRN
jgi:heat shock protein HtpX